MHHPFLSGRSRDLRRKVNELAKVEWTEGLLIEQITRRFRPPEWAVLSHVRDATGARAGRTADAIAMNLWPSRGLEIHGFEVKISRTDWLKELKNPIKADEIARYCDRWWLVVSDKAIVLPGELPGSWGLLYPQGSGLRCEQAPDKLKAEPIDNLFLAAILRRAHESINSSETMRMKYQEGRKDGEHRTRERLQAEIDETTRDNKKLKDLYDEFQKASGIDLRKFSWHEPGKLAEAFNTVLKGSTELKYKIDTIKRVRDDLTVILENKDLDHLKEIL